MCGFAGFLSCGRWNDASQADHWLERMGRAIESRGPDDAGNWYEESGIGLTHRRLSILDLTSAGRQPMISNCDRFVISFNGEIYNHLKLRSELEDSGQAPAWRGNSDTETLLSGFSAWGIRATVERCIGMFAFAVWDRAERLLTLARDRIGEKPLYYGWQGEGVNKCFLFGSELKALKSHPAFCAEINRDALRLFMRHNYIPAPHSIYRDIRKLQPGQLLTVSTVRRDPHVQVYWSLPHIVEAGLDSPFSGTDLQAVDSLETLLKSAIGQQMVADVPIGAFLSGGVDSSTVVALMQVLSNRPVKTFTIGFDDAGYNEAVHAKAVAHHLGTDHTELYVTSQRAMDVIPNLPSLYCEPFSDSSQIPTFLVSQLARQHVTVSLSGDAGDELFAGYNRYTLTHKLWNTIQRVPFPIRKIAAKCIHSISTDSWNSIFDAVKPFVVKKYIEKNFGDKLHKGAELLGAHSTDQLYLGMVTHWDPESIVIGGQEPLTVLSGNRSILQGLDDIQSMMLADSLTYLPDDILVKVDRAAMGVSLEGRVPFLDHRVVEFAWRLPIHMKLRRGEGKWILRQVLYRHVPRALIERPKMGFGAPIDKWLRGSLRDWAEQLLNEKRLQQEGYFHHAPIREMWAEHLSGKRNWQHHLWDVLMFQAWLSEQSKFTVGPS